jgi:hypothetical protein
MGKPAYHDLWAFGLPVVRAHLARRLLRGISEQMGTSLSATAPLAAGLGNDVRDSRRRSDQAGGRGVRGCTPSSTTLGRY